MFLFIAFYNLTLSAQDIESVFNEAVQYYKEGKYTNAIKSYTKVIKKDSTYSYVFVNRALCYYAINDYKNARSDLDHVFFTYPTDTLVLNYMGELYCNIGIYSSAIQCYKKAISLGTIPNHHIYGDIGTSYYFSGQIDSARKYLQMSYNLNQTSIVVIDNLAWANLDYNPNKSCLLFNEAYMMDSLNVRTINNLGYSHLLCGNLDKGYELISKAEKLDPTNSFVYRNYGLYYMKKNNKTLACKNLQKAIDLKIIEEWGESYVAELMIYCNKK